MNKRLIANVKGNKVHEFYFSEFEIADFFTRINNGRYIHTKTMDGVKVSIKPDDIESVLVLDEDGKVEFDSRNNEDFEIEDDFDVEGFVKVAKQIEFELDTIEKLAEAMEARFPFVKILIDYEIDEDEIEEYVSSFQG